MAPFVCLDLVWLLQVIEAAVEEIKTEKVEAESISAVNKPGELPSRGNL